MKPQINSDFLRGALFIFLAHELLDSGDHLWMAAADLKAFDIVWHGAFFVPALLLCWGLLFRPAKSATLAFAFVVVLFLQQAFGAGLLLWARPSQQRIQEAIHTMSFVFSPAPLLVHVLVSLLFVGLAFIYWRTVHPKRLQA